MNIYFNNKIVGTTSVKCSISLPNRIDYYTSHKVNDEVRYYLIHDGVWNVIPPLCVQKTYSIKKLALILESPHEKEYQPNIFIPIGPAKGRTGYCIAHYLVNRPWIKNLDKESVYEIYIMNSIQYQCSAINIM